MSKEGSLCSAKVFSSVFLLVPFHPPCKVFPVHIIHTAVNSLEGIQKTHMYLVQKNLEGHLSEVIVIPEEKTSFLNYDICKIAGVDDQVTTESSKPFCLPHQLVSFRPHAWSTAFPTHPFPVQSGFTSNPNAVLI